MPLKRVIAIVIGKVTKASSDKKNYRYESGCRYWTLLDCSIVGMSSGGSLLLIPIQVLYVSIGSVLLLEWSCGLLLKCLTFFEFCRRLC